MRITQLGMARRRQVHDIRILATPAISTQWNGSANNYRELLPTESSDRHPFD